MYVLIDSNNRVHAWAELGEGETWTYPNSFTLIEVESVDFDPSYNNADYVYHDGEFVLDPESVEAPNDIDALVTAKVNAAMAQAETRIMAETSKQISQAALQPISTKPGKLE